MVSCGKYCLSRTNSMTFSKAVTDKVLLLAGIGLTVRAISTQTLVPESEVKRIVKDESRKHDARRS